MERILEMYFNSDQYLEDYTKLLNIKYKQKIKERKIVDTEIILKELLTKEDFSYIESKLAEQLNIVEEMAFTQGFKFAFEVKELVGGVNIE